MKEKIIVKILWVEYLKNDYYGNPQYLIVYKKRGRNYAQSAITQKGANFAYGVGSYLINKWCTIDIEYKAPKNTILYLTRRK